ncbi:hypothetical protein SERLA73DRAFT_173808 [Serpula lacrymans var. lacrymans S7.3]|uniref:Uncharacterized protein n=2 Tax=Serpula lacrymans var. lacrymans TaxID=341189 RepID=F8PH99_SERL3|nr:uncharacterized protein SERLADRAFT_454692 [Serpula lacrymans var. lacrymans S7.9]EGO04483.1 hypothetical protein SERLA73DRAFT_173808 [Serpula lacrymans var. lacrymans S7.3]EGO30365.1 hypothetical protein SERLADRAFT_454692 [Serpula lacrymans var. lacrymans S7.9]
MTVFLLLRSLRYTKKCGTFAKAFLDSWKKRWGAKMESSMVRRRVAILALKEGRFDIVDEMMASEKQRKHLESLWYTEMEVVGGGLPQLRPPRRLRLRKYAHKGTENRRWTKLKQRIDRVAGEEEAAARERAGGGPRLPIQSDQVRACSNEQRHFTVRRI